MTLSSNVIENNNSLIKTKMSRGHLPLSGAENKLKEQFLDQLTNVTLIQNKNLNIRKPKARNREIFYLSTPPYIQKTVNYSHMPIR